MAELSNDIAGSLPSLALDSANPWRNDVIFKILRYMKKESCVYILASNKNGTLYVGVTSNLVQRVYQHRENLVEGFTKRYGVHKLVWYELHETMENAILKEKRQKTWERTAKIRLIESINGSDSRTKASLPQRAADAMWGRS